MKWFLFLVIMSSMGGCMALGGCGGGGDNGSTPKSAPAPAKTYVCPMHPDVVRNEPGNCPKCGMKLEEKTNAGGHSH